MATLAFMVLVASLAVYAAAVQILVAWDRAERDGYPYVTTDSKAVRTVAAVWYSLVALALIAMVVFQVV